MKVYTLGRYGFVSDAAHDLLGLPPHVRQADMHVVAHTKRHAAEVLTACGFYALPASSPDFRVVEVVGSHIEPLAEAGLLDSPGVIVQPNSGGPRCNEVALFRPGWAPVVAGRFEGFGSNARFVLAEDGA